MLSLVAFIEGQSTMFIILIDLSNRLIENGKKLTVRNTKKICQRLSMEEAYPFYPIWKDTFVAFLEEGLDKSIIWLLW